MKQLAIIGPTASGKTALSISLAKALDGYVLSLDSLAIYKDIDIASAKPTSKERGDIPHFGIDLLTPNESFDVTTYIKLYKEIYKKAKDQDKALIIVGGTSFYLKMLIDGISQLPAIDVKVQKKVQFLLQDNQRAYNLLADIDPQSALQIKSNDSYRIEKMLSIYLQTKQPPSKYFLENPPKPAIQDLLPIYEINMDRGLLRERIKIRTQQMLEDGLIDEVVMLEKSYGRSPNCMKSIGIRECLDYLDGKYTLEEMLEKISINTGRLAKRQETFNRSQFTDKFTGSSQQIFKEILG